MNEVVVSQKPMSLHDRAVDIGAKALVCATNFVGKAMNTRGGRIALCVPLAVTLTTTTVVYADGDNTAQNMIDTIMGVLKPGIVALGSLVAVVGGVQTGIGFKDDNADGKTRGFQTLIGGAIIAAVGGIIPDSITIGTGG